MYALHMSDTSIVALAGIGGTALGALIGALVSPWAHGRIDRRNRLLDRRIDAYADLLELVRTLHDNALVLATSPSATVEDPPKQRVDSMIARIRVIGSNEVHGRTNTIAELAFELHRKVYAASKVHLEGASELRAEADRIELSAALTAAVEALQVTVRKEMYP
jgi:hypothetical protein